MLRAYIKAFHDEDDVAETTSPGCWVAGMAVSLLILIVGLVASSDLFGGSHYDPMHALNKYAFRGIFQFLLYPVAAMFFYCVYAFFKSRKERSMIADNRLEVADKEQAKSVSDYALFLKRAHGYNDEDLEIALPQYGLSFRDTKIIIRNLKS